MTDKRIYWMGSAKNDLSGFPLEARRKIGFQLRSVQKGQDPTNFKSMSVIGRGVEEIRVRAGDAYRVFYIARFKEAVYVLHAFQKKAQKTSKQDIELGQQRYRKVLEFRQQQIEDSENGSG